LALDRLGPTLAFLAAVFVLAALAALLANLVNNVPATLVLTSVVAPGATGQLLALLVGVNVGPNLTDTGSLATLPAAVEPPPGEFFRLAVLTTPLALVLATVMLWLTLRVTG
jgi:arsenical pump membrane protein